MSNSHIRQDEQGSRFYQDTNIFEDEINLTDYLKVISNWKWFILTATLLPTLAVVVILFLSARTYKMTFVYDVHKDLLIETKTDVMNTVVNDVSVSDTLIEDLRSNVSNWNLTARNYNIMLSRFNSEENLRKLANELQKNGVNEYAKQVNGSLDGIKKFIEFKTTPDFLDISKLKITDLAQLHEIGQMEALSLNVTITGKEKNNMLKICSVIRDNIENVIPLYMLQELLATDIRRYKNKQSQIESNRFPLELILKQNRNMLADLKKAETRPLNDMASNDILRREIGNHNLYLPSYYQVQVVESKVIWLGQEISTNEAKYKYYSDLISLNGVLLAELNNILSSEYSIGKFKIFLSRLINEYEKQELKDYLSSYIIQIENRISASGPVTENPRLFSIPKNTAKKSFIVFGLSLMISLLAVFLIESLQKIK